MNKMLSLVILDNCTTNGALVEKVLVRFDISTFIFSGNFFHMRCTTQILNFAMWNGLKVLENGVAKIRESVCY